jgi:4-amino-4-deoxy-L-arabinose transferase-like glycosyltransferase
MSPSSQRDIAWMLLLMLYVLLGTRRVPFHGDEATLIMMSRDYRYEFLEGDLEKVRYREPPLNDTEQRLRLLNGSVSKYLIGAAWHLSGYSVDDLNGKWIWAKGFTGNIHDGNKPSDALLGVARWPMALLTALSVVIVFALARTLGGRPAAYVAAFLFATHPVILVQGRRAMMEAPVLFFSLSTVGMAVVQAAQWKRHADRQGLGSWLALLGLGAASGLAVASKHSGLVPVAAAYFALVSLLVWKFRSHAVARLGALALSAALAFGLFLALNVAWWDDPVGRALKVLELRRTATADQDIGFQEARYPSLSARVSGLVKQLSTADTQYYEDPSWGKYISEAILAYRTSPWSGMRYGSSPLSALLASALLAMTLVGLARLIAGLRTGDENSWIIGLWGALSVLTVVATISRAWQRYYMPIYPVQVILAGWGIAWLGSWFPRKTQGGG